MPQRQSMLRGSESNWKQIDGFAGYEISSDGRVRSFKRGKPLVLRQYLRNRGYCYVYLYCSGKYHAKLVHRLVASAFLRRVDGKSQVNHKNGIKTDNDVGNLEWVTNLENVHAFNPNVKLTEMDVTEIRELRGIFSQRDIAAAYGISQRSVYNLHHDLSWKYVK